MTPVELSKRPCVEQMEALSMLRGEDYFRVSQLPPWEAAINTRTTLLGAAARGRPAGPPAPAQPQGLSLTPNP